MKVADTKQISQWFLRDKSNIKLLSVLKTKAQHDPSISFDCECDIANFTNFADITDHPSSDVLMIRRQHQAAIVTNFLASAVFASLEVLTGTICPPHHLFQTEAQLWEKANRVNLGCKETTLDRALSYSAQTVKV